MDNVSGVLIRFKDQFLTFTNVPGIKIGVIDIIEILIISVLFYHILLWIKTKYNTKKSTNVMAKTSMDSAYISKSIIIEAIQSIAFTGSSAHTSAKSSATSIELIFAI
jgi:hypothetical protein